MKATLSTLIELQRVDDELDALEALKGDLPQRVEQMRREMDEMQRNYDSKKNELEETKRSKLHLEGEIADLREKLKKYQEQLYSVTSNREYDAITVEIDAVKEKIDDAETRVLELFESEETLEAEVKRGEGEIGSLKEHLAVKEKELQQKIQETEQESQHYQQQREELVRSIRKPILHQYERIRRGLGSTAVVEISNYACGGCFSAIPPQKVVEIKTMSQLIICESCGRILVAHGEKQSVANSKF